MNDQPKSRLRRGNVWTNRGLNDPGNVQKPPRQSCSVFMFVCFSPVDCDGGCSQAIWVTSAPGSEGEVYGNIGTWNGIGLFLDSFDNDGMVRL